MKNIAFAELLHDLATEECKKALPTSSRPEQPNYDVANPMYVVEWFLAALGGDPLPTQSFANVQKKIRDQVQYSGHGRPWRRSPMWAVLKGILSVVCVHTTDNKMTYKFLVEHFLCFTLKTVLAYNPDSISHSSIKYALGKLVRRSEKMHQTYNVQTDNYAKNLQACLLLRQEVIQVGMSILESKWADRCAGEEHSFCII